MRDDLFNELLESVEQAGAIRRDEMEPSRSFRYEGRVLVEIREKGKTTWTLEQAANEMATRKDLDSLDCRSIRETLRQSQAGFADLLGISVGTLRGWEQGRREPQGSARVLLRVAATDPMAVLHAVRGAHKRTKRSGTGPSRRPRVKQ